MALEHWIWLQQVLGYAPKNLKVILNKYGDAENIYSSKHSAELLSLLTSTQQKKLNKTPLADISNTIERCKQLGIEIVSYCNPKYPNRLKNLFDPPAVIYIKGELSDIDGECAVAIVGPREATEYGLKSAFSLSRRLSAAGCLIVSGGAKGADGMAHAGALSLAKPTLAVLGCGINYDYPKDNADLRELISKNGCLVSEYPPDFPPSKISYPCRNRLISALTLGTVVVEAKEKSGSLITASHSAEQGKDVFAVPGNPSNPYSVGTNKLIKDGAKPLLTAADVLEEYYPLFPQKIDLEAAKKITSSTDDYKKACELLKMESKPEEIKKVSPKKEEKTEAVPKGTAEKQPAPDYLSGVTKEIYNSLPLSYFTADDIVEQSGIAAAEVVSSLVELEIFGLIQSVSGARYKII